MPMQWRTLIAIIASSTMLLKVKFVGKIVLAIILSLTFTVSLWKLIICAHDKLFDEFNGYAVDEWLEENDLGEYKQLFKNMGKLLIRPKKLW